jgi:hypothetical protein
MPSAKISDRRQARRTIRDGNRANIRITHVPTGVPLVSGMTATVTIRDAGAQESSAWLREHLASLKDHLNDVIDPARPSLDCVPRIGRCNRHPSHAQTRGATQS